MAVKPEALAEEHLQYLDELRESGVTNMWNAPAYLEADFDLPERDARDIMLYWMKTFMERHPND